ncbi:N-acetylmuramoyl-L-alanine amidase [Sporanaerobacter acetigenes]|uniref:N-acetylmuramoyl-L-alanine amidase n=1 Tax=Sporanaerobacter acetigenes TaxID=165813 RepID=UPI00331B9842
MFYIEKQEIFQKPLEEIIEKLLPSQIDIDFNIECLKAQAVIARTNMVREYLKIDKSNSIYSSYRFYSELELKEMWNEKYIENIEKIKKAVEETKGLVITMEGKPIMARYHDTCGGSTENSENVIKNEVNYLRKVLCLYCQNSPNLIEEKDFSIEDIENALKVKFHLDNPYSKGEIKGFFEDIVRDEENRVLSINVGGKVFSGKEIMEGLHLNSTRFYMTPLYLRFTSKGKGDGLGFCQYGGNELANRGYSFLDILEYYYTGVEIEKYSLPGIENPLYGKTIMIDPGHGGKDFGHMGELGSKEKDIVLEVAKILKEELEKLGGEVYLTRELDEEVLLSKRSEMANRIRPDFFISLHMNYFPKSNMKGCEIYCFKEDAEGRKMGNILLENLEGIGVVNRGVKEGNFYLLKSIGVSTIMIELGFLSNLEEEKCFLEENFIKRLSYGITLGILEYFEY